MAFKNEYLNRVFEKVQASLIFAETDSEGIAYDVAYNLRMNGCIVEFYTGAGNIDDAVSYTKDNGLGCILRVFSDGKLMINDFAKNEIIETTAFDFLGYYDEDEEDECDCGCGGHHHHHAVRREMGRSADGAENHLERKDLCGV